MYVLQRSLVHLIGSSHWGNRMAEGTVFLAIKTVGALSLVLGILLALNYCVKRWGTPFAKQGGDGDLIQVVATKMILPKKYVSIVDVCGNQLIIGISEQGIHLLGEIANNVSFRALSDKKGGSTTSPD